MFMKQTTNTMENNKKIIIDTRKFDFNIGCRILKLKYNDCPFPELEGIWDDIEPLTFQEISQMDNIEDRRIGIKCLGIDRLVKEIKPKLVDRSIIKKETTWVDKDGELISKKFDDVYELYEVMGEDLFSGTIGGMSWMKSQKYHYVKCKDTSTDREYLIWVDFDNVARTNSIKWDKLEKNGINAIQAVAWTITTNVPEGKIETIIRQGDCILIKPKPRTEFSDQQRHLTEKEYRTLLVCES